MTKTSLPRKLSILLAGCVLSTALDAATVGYWRFETDAYSDSSGNGYDFLNSSPANDLVRTAIPGSGNGSAFPDTIPQTSASNGFMVTHDSSDDFLSSGAIDSSASGEDTRKTFTFETYTNIDRLSDNAFLATYWNGGSSSRAWAVQLLNSGNQLNMLVSANGTSHETAASTFSLVEDTDYYIGIAVDLSSAVQAERTVTFYLQDLTNGGSLQTYVANNIATDEINAVTNTGLTLGDVGGGGFATRLDAQFDEVRFSNTALSSNELLVSVPEPSAYALIAGLGTLLCLAGRRRLR